MFYGQPGMGMGQQGMGQPGMTMGQPGMCMGQPGMAMAGMAGAMLGQCAASMQKQQKDMLIREMQTLIATGQLSSPRLVEIAVTLNDKNVISEAVNVAGGSGFDRLAEWIMENKDWELGRKLLKRPIPDDVTEFPENYYDLILQLGDVNQGVKLHEHKAFRSLPQATRRGDAYRALGLLQWVEKGVQRLAESVFDGYLFDETPEARVEFLCACVTKGIEVSGNAKHLACYREYFKYILARCPAGCPCKALAIAKASGNAAWIQIITSECQICNACKAK